MIKKLFLTVLFSLLYTTNYAQDSFIASDNENYTNTFAESNDLYLVIPTAVNSKQSEVGCAFFMNKYIMYSSRRTGAIGAGKDSNTNLPYNALYCNNVDKNGNLSKPYFFASILDSKGNEGSLTFSPNQKTIYYTKSKVDNSENYQLYKSVFDEECKCKWIEELPVSFNSTDYSIENPAISTDGKILYFSSNMPGGYGGYDLYAADINADGLPVNPVNLGQNINTTRDEKFPYVSPEKEFYFSSNGHYGYGGLDVFVAKITKKDYRAPLNLGKTINTAADEIAFILATKHNGYVTSNRTNGQGDFDIYRFDVQKTPTTIKGNTIEKYSKIVLPNTTVTLLNEDGEEVVKQTTTETGSNSFDIDPLENYSITAKKEGYLDFGKPVNVRSGNTNTFFNIELDQKTAEIVEVDNKKLIAIENIYFDYNKAQIKKESTLSLNKIYTVLQENPAMKISINAHTDSRGSDKYNLILSEKRAFEAKQYLIKKGISQDRIESNGFGENESISSCKENCSEAQYTTDRRVEFIIK
jgi:outer membrane protein OmpA-like peptidoglycan-associated protein